MLQTLLMLPERDISVIVHYAVPRLQCHADLSQLVQAAYAFCSTFAAIDRAEVALCSV
jgi:hypothetical protein